MSSPDQQPNDEATPLLPSGEAEEAPTWPASKGSNGHSSSVGVGFFTRRVVLWTLVVLLSLASLGYFQYEVLRLTQQVQEGQDKVAELTNVVEKQEKEMEKRLNLTITTTQVMTELHDVQKRLEDTRKEVQHDLQKVREQVEQEVQSTVQQLNETVSAAQLDISEQVRNVRSTVEHYVIQTQDQLSLENSFLVYQLAGTLTLLSVLISLWHMTAHVRKMYQPLIQRRILSILYMSPLYAVTSWFSLVFPSAEGYLSIIKDGYEAYVIYQFLAFCIAVIGKGDRETVVDLLARHADHLTPPFRLFGFLEVCGCREPVTYENNRALARDVLLQCQVFAMQFVFLRPLTTTALVVLKHYQYYGAGDGPTDYRSPQFYIVIIQNLSIAIAFTGLLKFYHAVDQELAWCRPFAKFMCIKGVVFMTFWQGMAIRILAETTDVVGGGDTSDRSREDRAEEWAASAQNFMICFEMLLFSIAHFYCFPVEEWEPGYRVKHSKGQFGDTIALGDFFQDLKLILRSNSYSKKKKKTHKPSTVMEDEGDDETDVDSTAISEITEDEKLVAEALKDSLAVDDPEIAEARERLLANKLLTSREFSNDEDEKNTSVVVSDQGDIEQGTEQDGDNDKRASPISSLGSEERQELPTEQTALLSNAGDTSFMEVLRPSIFTSVASIAEIQKNRNASLREIRKRLKEPTAD